MVPVEWPIAAPAADGGTVRARRARASRLPTVRQDFFLDAEARLAEQERALMSAMLSDLVATLADEFAAAMPDLEPANLEGHQLFEQLWEQGLLDIADLISLLLRRAEEERIAAGVRAGRAPHKPRLVQSLVSDADADVAAAAMALILARSRRRDRFDGPRVSFDDLSAEAAVALANAVAAGLRFDLCRRLDADEADQRLSTAARTLLSRHDEAERLESKLFALVHALDRTGRLDEALVRSAFQEADMALLAEALARKGGITFEASWQQVTGGSGSMALLLKMAGVSRELAGEIIAGAADVAGSDPETEIQAFDRLADEDVERRRKWLRLDPDYRAAIGAVSGDHGERAI